MNTNHSGELIMGLAVDMTLETLKPFFLSLEKTDYRGDVCLFVSGLDGGTLNFLRARKVSLVPFQTAFTKPLWAKLVGVTRPFMARNQADQLEELVAISCIHPQDARYWFYRNYLDKCGDNYDRILLTDIRDVLFQAAPFSFDMPNGLSVFLEDCSQTIGTCPSNSAWMRQGLGDGILKELAKQPIICSGTIFGTNTALRNHADQLFKLCCRIKQTSFFDQAAHNFILYKQPPPSLHFFRNDFGPVLTMAHVKPEHLRFNDNGLLVDVHGRVYNMLHQYDRHPMLAQRLVKTLT